MTAPVALTLVPFLRVVSFGTQRNHSTLKHMHMLMCIYIYMHVSLFICTSGTNISVLDIIRLVDVHGQVFTGTDLMKSQRVGIKWLLLKGGRQATPGGGEAGSEEPPVQASHLMGHFQPSVSFGLAHC